MSGGMSAQKVRTRREAFRGAPCHYCGSPSDTVDHVVPRALGGTHRWENVVPACRRCNLDKGSDGRADHCDFCATAWWHALRVRVSAARAIA